MDRNDLLRWQDWLCWACRTPLDRVQRCCDHDHLTGLIRGWLCAACNFAEGHDTAPSDLHGDEWEAWSWDEYRRNPPARQMGLSEHYDGPSYAVPAWGDYDRLRAGKLLRRSRLERRDEIAEQTGLSRELVDEIAELVRPLVERDRREELEDAPMWSLGLRAPSAAVDP